MTTVSFKAEDSLKETLDFLARRKGINMSAYIKLILTEKINEDLTRITQNGLTLAEEMEILVSAREDKTVGPFGDVKSLMKALKKN